MIKGKVQRYTERIDGFQIQDVCYFGIPPKDTPIRFDVVKWVEYSEPTKCFDVSTGKIETHEEYCYSVATLVWDDKESCFDFNSVGLRWLESNPTEAIVKAILDFCILMTAKLREDDYYD